MKPFEVIVARVRHRGITVAELSRRVEMDDELLRRSMKGSRKLRDAEFIRLCKELDLNLDDF
jgi:lambda repressor-like predicted transcriptional regulator